MARKTKEQKAAEKAAKAEASKAKEEAPVAEEVVEEEAQVIAEEVVEEATKEEEVVTTSPFRALAAKTDEEKVADASDTQDALRVAGGEARGLSICGTALTAVEEQSVRGAVELHYRAKGLRFRGISLKQDKLDELLTDGAFLGRLGYLRSLTAKKKK